MTNLPILTALRDLREQLITETGYFRTEGLEWYVSPFVYTNYIRYVFNTSVWDHAAGLAEVSMIDCVPVVVDESLGAEVVCELRYMDKVYKLDSLPAG